MLRITNFMKNKVFHLGIARANPIELYINTTIEQLNFSNQVWVTTTEQRRLVYSLQHLTQSFNIAHAVSNINPLFYIIP